MTEGDRNPRQTQKKLIVAVAFLVLAGFIALLALLISGTSSSDAGTIDSASYAAELEVALAGADAAIGEGLVTETDCATCHMTGDGTTAPRFDGLASIAAQRRPPLSAEQYLYEAIILPAAHLVDGYANAMPNNYGERFSPADLGHMIAYLLTLTAEAQKL